MSDCCESLQTRFRVFWSMLAALAFSLPGSALWSQDVLPYMETGVGRKQGDFGSPTRSTFWLGYATYGVTGARWDASLTVPFLWLNRDGGGDSSQDQGIGDVVVRGSYRFLPENEDGWSLDGEGAVKLPTASDTKGLGTGRTDVGGFLALHQRLGLFQWTLLGGWIQGASTNQAGTADTLTSGSYVVGLRGTWDLNRNRWGVAFEARGATFQGEPGIKELSMDVFHPISSKWAMKAVITAGFSDGGPKQSVGVALVRVFP
ncbi:MAG: hypothetical protein IPQ13_07785 [Holophagaceae bacterium]|nr:hypothetical protein [Holophagaceae bacterium]